MILLTVPLFFPVVTALGYDPIWFGIIVVIVVQIGMISPPVGMNIFVVKNLLQHVSIGTVFRGVDAVHGRADRDAGADDRLPAARDLAAGLYEVGGRVRRARLHRRLEQRQHLAHEQVEFLEQHLLRALRPVPDQRDVLGRRALVGAPPQSLASRQASRRRTGRSPSCPRAAPARRPAASAGRTGRRSPVDVGVVGEQSPVPVRGSARRAGSGTGSAARRACTVRPCRADRSLIDPDRLGSAVECGEMHRDEAAPGAELDRLDALRRRHHHRRMRPLVGLRHDAGAHDAAVAVGLALGTRQLGRAPGRIALDAGRGNGAW